MSAQALAEIIFTLPSVHEWRCQPKRYLVSWTPPNNYGDGNSVITDQFLVFEFVVTGGEPLAAEAHRASVQEPFMARAW